MTKARVSLATAQHFARRAQDAAWLRDQIGKLVQDAEANAEEDTKLAAAARTGNEVRVCYEARSDTARHYARELRRILNGLTWDEDLVLRMKKGMSK